MFILKICKCSYLFNACVRHLSFFILRLFFSWRCCCDEEEEKMNKKKVYRLHVACRRDAFNKFVVESTTTMMMAEANEHGKRLRNKKRFLISFSCFKICDSIALIDMHLFLFTYWLLLIACGHFMFMNVDFKRFYYFGGNRNIFRHVFLFNSAYFGRIERGRRWLPVNAVIDDGPSYC